MEWTEVEQVATSDLLSIYDSRGVIRFRFDIEMLGKGKDDAHEMRWENARALIADWVNETRRLDAVAFDDLVADVWVGQRCERGRFWAEMEVVVASTRAWPARLRTLLTFDLATRGVAGGALPVASGAFPELRVSGGTVAHTWKLERAFLQSCSARYRQHHGLSPAAKDPYRQMLEGASEPSDFAWLESRPRRGRPAARTKRRSVLRP